MTWIHWVLLSFGVQCAVNGFAGAWRADADAHAVETDPRGSNPEMIHHARQLTFDGRRSGEGYFAPDGRSLIFQSERDPENPFYQIYRLDLETGDVDRVSPGIGKTTCAFFRPGTDQVLFASTHLDPEAEAKQAAELAERASGTTRRYAWDYDENMDIFQANRDGSALVRLTDEPGYDAEASYSPDGARIVFTSLRHAYASPERTPEEAKRLETDPAWFGEIYTMNADGSGVRRLTFHAGYDGGPFFSPDGRRIVWRRFDEDGVIADIYSMAVDGSDVRRITRFESMSWAPFYHPSGQYVIFASNKFGFENFELFVVAASGDREPVRVTEADGFDGLPVFSPDGRRICWTAKRPGQSGSQLFLGDWDHKAASSAVSSAPPIDDLNAQAAVRKPGAPNARADVDGGDGADEGAIRERDLREAVGFLSDPALEGRMTGAPGARAAAAYLARKLAAAGLSPVQSATSYYQPFEFTANVEAASGNGNSLRIFAGEATGPDGRNFKLDRDFRPLSFTANGTASGEVVFAGYGLKVPGELGEGYDSYAGLDVTNKIALVLRYVPEGVTPERRQQLQRYAGLRYKAMIAREHGAAGMLVVTGPTSPGAGNLATLGFDSSLAGSGIMAASITTEVADLLLAGSDRDLKALQAGLDNENPHARGGFSLPEVRATLSTAVIQVRETDRNVVAVIPPGAGGAGGNSDQAEYVLVGAHYDHLGHGGSSSLAAKDEETAIHPGADDNASGSALVLELAESLAAERARRPDLFQRGVIVGLWSGEELGLLGSTRFAENPPVPLDRIVAYVNFDMVGRLRDNKLNLQGVGSSPAWRGLIERRNVAAGFDLTLQDDPYLPTDVTAFYPRGIPVLNFFTGNHEDYHRPTDTVDRVNFDGLLRISRFARAIVAEMVSGKTTPEYVKVEQSSQGGNRDQLRIYLGTIPDYTSDVKGVRLTGVRGGGPADQAGLRGGDVIVSFAGQEITNIYDYTYALDAAKPNQPTEIVVIRDAKKETLTIVPAVRQ